MRYDWEVAEDLCNAVETDEVEGIASTLEYLDSKSGLDEEDEIMLYIAREYAHSEDYEGLKQRSEDILGHQNTFSDSLKAGFVTISGILSSNTGYDYLFNQEVSPGTFAGGMPEIVTALATGSAFVAIYHLRNSKDSEDRFAEIEDRLEESFPESTLPELEEAYTAYKN